MNPSDISILVIDRNIDADDFDRLEGCGDLDWEVSQLKEVGYRVEHIARTPSLITGYDIVIAHPHHGEGRKLQEFHIAYPRIPLVIHGPDYSFYISREHRTVEGIQGFMIDAEGVYIAMLDSHDGFLNLIEHLRKGLKEK